MYHKCPNRTNSTEPGTRIKVELSRRRQKTPLAQGSPEFFPKLEKM